MKNASSAREIRPSFPRSAAGSNFAQSMGVSVSETRTESRIETPTVTANSRNRSSSPPANQESPNEDRYQRNQNRKDGEADVVGAVERGLERRRAALDMPDNILDHDNGVVDDEADRDRERHQGQIVETVAQDVHHREGSDQRNRHRNRGNDGRPKFSQEDRDDANDEGDRQEQREAHVGKAGRDGLGSVGYDLDVNARRQRGSELR